MLLIIQQKHVKNSQKNHQNDVASYPKLEHNKNHKKVNVWERMFGNNSCNEIVSSPLTTSLIKNLKPDVHSKYRFYLTVSRKRFCFDINFPNIQEHKNSF